jgi:hypothetical protein
MKYDFHNHFVNPLLKIILGNQKYQDIYPKFKIFIKFMSKANEEIVHWYDTFMLNYLSFFIGNVFISQNNLKILKKQLEDVKSKEDYLEILKKIESLQDFIKVSIYFTINLDIQKNFDIELLINNDSKYKLNIENLDYTNQLLEQETADNKQLVKKMEEAYGEYAKKTEQNIEKILLEKKEILKELRNNNPDVVNACNDLFENNKKTQEIDEVYSTSKEINSRILEKNEILNNFKKFFFNFVTQDISFLGGLEVKILRIFIAIQKNILTFFHKEVQALQDSYTKEKDTLSQEKIMSIKTQYAFLKEQIKNQEKDLDLLIEINNIILFDSPAIKDNLSKISSSITFNTKTLEFLNLFIANMQNNIKYAETIVEKTHKEMILNNDANMLNQLKIKNNILNVFINTCQSELIQYEEFKNKNSDNLSYLNILLENIQKTQIEKKETISLIKGSLKETEIRIEELETLIKENKEYIERGAIYLTSLLNENKKTRDNLKNKQNLIKGIDKKQRSTPAVQNQILLINNEIKNYKANLLHFKNETIGLEKLKLNLKYNTIQYTGLFELKAWRQDFIQNHEDIILAIKESRFLKADKILDETNEDKLNKIRLIAFEEKNIHIMEKINKELIEMCKGIEQIILSKDKKNDVFEITAYEEILRYYEQSQKKYEESIDLINSNITNISEDFNIGIEASESRLEDIKYILDDKLIEKLKANIISLKTANKAIENEDKKESKNLIEKIEEYYNKQVKGLQESLESLEENTKKKKVEIDKTTDKNDFIIKQNKKSIKNNKSLLEKNKKKLYNLKKALEIQEQELGDQNRYISSSHNLDYIPKKGEIPTYELNIGIDDDASLMYYNLSDLASALDMIFFVNNRAETKDSLNIFTQYSINNILFSKFYVNINNNNMSFDMILSKYKKIYEVTLKDKPDFIYDIYILAFKELITEINMASISAFIKKGGADKKDEIYKALLKQSFLMNLSDENKIFFNRWIFLMYSNIDENIKSVFYQKYHKFLYEMNAGVLSLNLISKEDMWLLNTYNIKHMIKNHDTFGISYVYFDDILNIDKFDDDFILFLNHVLKYTIESYYNQDIISFLKIYEGIILPKFPYNDKFIIYNTFARMVCLMYNRKQKINKELMMKYFCCVYALYCSTKEFLEKNIIIEKCKNKEEFMNSLLVILLSNFFSLVLESLDKSAK